MISRSVLTALAGVALLLVGCGTAAGPTPPSEPVSTPTTAATSDAHVVCRIKDQRLPEISGLATSILHPDVVWTHNDSGDSARVFAIDTTDCAVRAVVNLRGVTSTDAEAIAVGRDSAGTPVIYLGDIGDNERVRASVSLYRFPEPEVLEDSTVAATTIPLTYPGGARDAEGLLVDPVAGGRIWVISKSLSGADYYLAPSSGPGVLKKVGPGPGLTTDASYAPDGSSYVVRSYLSAELFAAPPIGKSLGPVAIPLQSQGEAITYAADSKSLYVASEGSGELIQVPLNN